MAGALHFFLDLVAAAHAELSLLEFPQALNGKHWDGFLDLPGALPELQQFLLLYPFEMVALDVPF